MTAIHPRLSALQPLFAPCPLVQIHDPIITAAGVELWIKRDDLLHPIISGNKWRKLKYIINHALDLDTHTLISMGGAYSNHLHALAFAGKALQLKTVAYIRGERPVTLNATLQDLLAWSMELRFVSRSAYRTLRDYKTHDSLPGLATGEYWLPEGGAMGLALQGVAESVNEITLPYDVLMVACGTGTTLAGLIAAAPAHCQAIGIAALKAPSLVAEVSTLLEQQGVENSDWQILLDYHCGGFAKTTPALIEFIHHFSNHHGIPLEPVYTGKLLLAVYDLLNQGFFSRGQRIVVFHTGGLQGTRQNI